MVTFYGKILIMLTQADDITNKKFNKIKGFSKIKNKKFL
jgi:hypothetical protein